jgi:hypothetical protein
MLSLRLRAGFLDDIALGGPSAALEAALAELRPALADAGLELNTSKCEVVARRGSDPRSLFGFGLLSPLSSFSFLGAPCGTDALSRESFVEDALAPVFRRIKRIAAVGRLDPHCGLALLRYCGSFPCGVFYAPA